MFYYLATRWDSMKKILRRIATSCIPILGVVLIYAFDPSANPEVKNVQGVGARLEAGKHQLDKEIASEFKDLEKKLSKPQKPKEHDRSPNLDAGKPGRSAKCGSAILRSKRRMEWQMHQFHQSGLDGERHLPHPSFDSRVTRPNLEDLLALDRSFAVLFLLGRVGGCTRSPMTVTIRPVHRRESRAWFHGRYSRFRSAWQHADSGALLWMRHGVGLAAFLGPSG